MDKKLISCSNCGRSGKAHPSFNPRFCGNCGKQFPLPPDMHKLELQQIADALCNKEMHKKWKDEAKLTFCMMCGKEL